MWSDRKPWWVKKSKDNAEDNPHYKDWCVVKVGKFENRPQNFNPVFVVTYKPCLRSNAPQYFDPARNKLKKAIEVDNLTKHEAYCVAKGLNFLDGETNGN